MKKCFAILSLFVCLACMAADKPRSAAEKDPPDADKEFQIAVELQKNGKPQDALGAITRAIQLAPGNVQYITMGELLRQQIVGEYLEQGNHLAAAGDNAGAAQHFRSALEIDPQNAFVAQRLHDVAPPDGDPEHLRTMRLLASVDEVNIDPTPGKKSFHIQGDTRQAYTQVGNAFGITVHFDAGMNGRNVRFDLDNVDFRTVMDLLGKMTKTFWSPVTNHEVIVATENQEMRKQYERLAYRTYYVGNVSAQTDLNDLVNVLRNVFDMRFVSIQPNKNTITLRAPRQEVEAAASLIDNLMEAKPELMIDVKEFEIDTDNLRNMGINLPTSFQVFNIPSEIRNVLGSDAQPVINTLLQTGTIDPSKISASSLSNLAGSPLLAPFVFFGGGLTLTGISTPSISGQLAFNSSIAQTLEHMTLRSMDGEASSFLVGTHFPIVTSTFTDVAVSSTGASQLGNTPQFTYEDLGISLKTTPHYHSSGDITLKLELQIEGLGTLQVNSLPDITKRSYEGTITVHEGEPSAIMGSITEQETRSLQGLPLLSQIPGLNHILSSVSKDRPRSEILVVITPYVVRKPFRNHGSSVFWTLNP